MELLAVSKDAIRAHVIRYFHDVFGTPISAFKGTTNVRNAYSYSDRAWRQLANVFNKLSWMRRLGALLSPREMPGLNTIDDIANAIWSKLNRIVGVPSVRVGKVEQFSASKRRSIGSTGKKTVRVRAKPRRKQG